VESSQGGKTSVKPTYSGIQKRSLDRGREEGLWTQREKGELDRGRSRRSALNEQGGKRDRQSSFFDLNQWSKGGHFPDG